MSPARRRAMTLALMPEGQNLFNGKRTLLREEDWQRLEIGDPLDETLANGGRDGFAFPLIYYSPKPPAGQ